MGRHLETPGFDALASSPRRMTEPAFEIWHKPNGKFRLQYGKAGIDYDTLDLAEAGMKRIITPIIRRYDAAGKLLAPK